MRNPVVLRVLALLASVGAVAAGGNLIWPK